MNVRTWVEGAGEIKRYRERFFARERKKKNNDFNF